MVFPNKLYHQIKITTKLNQNINPFLEKWIKSEVAGHNKLQKIVKLQKFKVMMNLNVLHLLDIFNKEQRLHLHAGPNHF